MKELQNGLFINACEEEMTATNCYRLKEKNLANGHYRFKNPLTHGVLR
jgi:hypothetical protein